MKNKLVIRRSAAIVALITATICGVVASAVVGSKHSSVPVFVTTAQAATVEPAGNLVSFSPVVKRTAPAVVNISSTKVIKASTDTQRRGSRGRQQQNPLFDDPMFRQFFGDQNATPRDRRESGLGSGVIVS